MLTQESGPTGRGRNTAWWAGIANLFWWCDREKGVAGMIASQIVSKVMGMALLSRIRIPSFRSLFRFVLYSLVLT